MKLANGPSSYEVGELVAATSTYRVYLCEEVATGRQCLLQIAAEIEHNGAIDRSAYALRELKLVSDAIDQSYAASKGNPDKHLDYDKLFPELVDSFICQEQGKRRVNVLAFRNVEDVTRMVPLSNLRTKDRLRIDMQTSAWIMGRLLKLLGMVHHEGIAVRRLSGSNILLEPDKHYVVVFDWSSARFHPGKVPREERLDDIAQSAQSIIAALGGSLPSGAIPEADDHNRGYVDYLFQLAHRNQSDAQLAHHRFYDLVDGLWERKYYPFTTRPITD